MVFTVVKKRQFRMVIRVVKKAQFLEVLGCLKGGGLGWLLKSLKKAL